MIHPTKYACPVLLWLITTGSTEYNARAFSCDSAKLSCAEPLMRVQCYNQHGPKHPRFQHKNYFNMYKENIFRQLCYCILITQSWYWYIRQPEIIYIHSTILLNFGPDIILKIQCWGRHCSCSYLGLHKAQGTKETLPEPHWTQVIDSVLFLMLSILGLGDSVQLNCKHTFYYRI